jgi:hypothetical protein
MKKRCVHRSYTQRWRCEFQGKLTAVTTAAAGAARTTAIATTAAGATAVAATATATAIATTTTTTTSTAISHHVYAGAHRVGLPPGRRARRALALFDSCLV